MLCFLIIWQGTAVKLKHFGRCDARTPHLFIALPSNEVGFINRRRLNYKHALATCPVVQGPRSNVRPITKLRYLVCTSHGIAPPIMVRRLPMQRQRVAPSNLNSVHVCQWLHTRIVVVPVGMDPLQHCQ